MSSGLYLNDDEKKLEMQATRDGFGRGLLEAGRRNDQVVALCADLTDSTRINWFADAFPERFIEAGIAEQNLATLGSGLAAMGKIPFISSYAAFSPGRNWEQIKTTAALNEQPVKIVGAHAGIYTGPDGATHQMLEDIALMRVMPNMTVIVPGDGLEAEKATLAMAEDTEHPMYIRLSREKTPVFTSEKTPFSLTRASILTPGKDATIVATGVMTYQALLAARRLRDLGVEAELIHVPVVKPLDGVTIMNSAIKTGAVLTVEEAQIAGGLGGAVAEFMSEHHPVPVRRMGVKDRYGESGDPTAIFEMLGLNAKHIVLGVQKLLADISR